MNTHILVRLSAVMARAVACETCWQVKIVIETSQEEK